MLVLLETQVNSKKKITLLCTLRRWGFSCFMNVSIWLQYSHKLSLKIIYWCVDLHILKARDLSIPLLDDRKKLLKNNILYMYKLKLFIPENILVFLLIKCVHCGNNLGFRSLKHEQCKNGASPIITLMYIFWLIEVLCISKNDFQHMCFGGN